uniref:Uncharacterized protein n=1 Tax=Meloidogyne enterolobii TaxID=390850 RepID=A0A6V7WS87_MELEN|nr:unnamed protein product [Meloidogyne enterolobii]
MTKAVNCNFNCVYFVKIKNKWSEIGIKWYDKCCFNNCINTNKPIGNCIKGNGFVNIINDENIEYINCLDGKGGCDRYARVCAENSFKTPQSCSNYSLYYFEVKCKFEREKWAVWMNIGFKNCNKNNYTLYSANNTTIYNEKCEEFDLSTDFNNNDIFGCGLVYPPTNKLNEEFPYVFFTQNGKQIGKATLVNGNFDRPCVGLKCCSVETNFGNDLETKPFKYDISKHLILKEFY